MKKLFAILVSVVVCMSSFSINAFASEAQSPVYETIVHGDDPIITASSTPTEFYNLGGTNSYTATLIDLAAARGSYTLYYFATSTGKIYLKCDLLRSGTTTDTNRDLIIYLYEKSSASASGTLVDTATIHFTSSEYTARRTFTGLDSNKFYYIRFYNNSDTSPSSSKDISGTILVDDTYN